MMQTTNSDLIEAPPSQFQTLPARLGDQAAIILRCLLVSTCMVIAASAFARIESPAVIMLINTAANHLSKGAFDQATNALERALRIDPNNPRLWHYRAQVHFQRGDYELARNMAKKSSTLVADDAGMINQRQPDGELICHSGRGPQYKSDEYRELLKRHGITCSMSGSGSCYDNAAVESFFATLKRERTHRRKYRTRDEARADVFDYIERFYNPATSAQLPRQPEPSGV